MFGQPPEGTKRGAVVKDVVHQSFAIRGLEIVIVIEPGEGAANHAVAKMERSLERSDSTRELLPDAEVPGAPRHLVAEAEQAGGSATDRALARAGRGLDVCVYAPSKIEAPRWRSGNQKR